MLLNKKERDSENDRESTEIAHQYIVRSNELFRAVEADAGRNTDCDGVEDDDEGRAGNVAQIIKLIFAMMC